MLAVLWCVLLRGCLIGIRMIADVRLAVAKPLILGFVLLLFVGESR